MRLGDLDALKEAIETYDKFAYLPNGKLCPCRDLVELEMYLHYIHFDDVIKAIDNAPTVDTYTIEDIQEVRENSLILGAKLAQKPEGEWLKNANEIYKCSLCGAFGNPNYFRFCPNCGAKMKGGVEND